jgi:hypothetical protein
MKMDDRNIIQRGVRGIFLGFPINQAGYLYLQPATREFGTSVDVSFDEYFHSALAYPELIFRDALPTRTPTSRHASGDLNSLEQTGDPLVLPDSVPPTEPWTPYTVFPPEHPADLFFIDPAAFDNLARDPNSTLISMDQFQSTNPDLHSTAEEDTDDDSLYNNFPIASSLPQTKPIPRQSRRLQGLKPDFASIAITSQATPEVLAQAFASFSHLSFCSFFTPALKLDFALQALQETIPHLGEPGSDPLPFLPEPNRIPQILKLPEDIREAWLKAFRKELRGLIVSNKCFKIEDPPPTARIVPLMEIFKCKLDKFGKVDKLKCRIVFRGDLYKPTEELDSWNPHATWTSLKYYLGLCSFYRTFPAQIDFVMAYVQTDMREEKVYVKLPEFWRKLLPEDLQPYAGTPLLLLKALYGYRHSGKFLWEDQSEFLYSENLRPLNGMPALWILKLPQGGVHLVLQYSDDFLSACTDSVHHAAFKHSLEKRFNVEWQPRADWYLQARIQQDQSGNIYLDQQRYAKAVVKRYLPNSPLIPNEQDQLKFASPLPSDMIFNPSDRSTSKEQVQALELKYSIRPIEAIASLNFLSNTTYEETFAIRKLCSVMSMPGELHFKALIHLLHHIRCHPPNAICFYCDVTHSPLYGLLQSAGLPDINPILVAFSDASWGDTEDRRSTGSYLIFFQGGIISHSTFVPSPIAMSSAESEIYAMTVTAMIIHHIRQVFCDTFFDDADRPFSVPLLTDSSSGIFITKNNKDNARTKHIERKWMFIRTSRQNGSIIPYHIDGNKYNLADLGTKNKSSPANSYKISICEAPVTDSPIQV